jgi:hypothetical protein
MPRTLPGKNHGSDLLNDPRRPSGTAMQLCPGWVAKSNQIEVIMTAKRPFPLASLGQQADVDRSRLLSGAWKPRSNSESIGAGTSAER